MNRHLTGVMIAVFAAAMLFPSPALADHRPGNVIVMGGLFPHCSERQLIDRLRQRQCLLWVKSGPTAAPPGRSAPGGEADEIGAKADVGLECRLLGVT